MNTAHLFLRQAPWFHIAVTTPSDITNFGWSLANGSSFNVAVRFLRGKKISSLDHMHREFGAALQFPWYYGENWAALDECINDLDWIRAEVYILVVTDAQEILAKESREQFCSLINLLGEAAREWNSPPDDECRQPVPFHIILQCTETDKEEVIANLQAASASFEQIDISMT
jgi:RNAse (barnase) inhibitor barstar